MLAIRPVGYIIGWLVALLGLLMIPSMLLDLVDGSGNAEAFALAAVLTIVLGTSVAVACASAATRSLSLKQGFLLTATAWALFPAIAGLPLMLGPPRLGFTDAYFEFTSALTATGATVMAGLEELPRGVLLWRMLTTWLGGIGVILLAMILLPVLGVGGMQLLRTADFNTLGKIMPRAKSIALSIGAVYSALTLACAVGFAWGGMSEFDALSHAMAAVATGGMGNYDSSFADFSPAAQYVATVFMLLGSFSFIRFVQAARGEPQALWRDSQIRAFLAIYAAFSLALVGARALHGDAINEPSVRAVLFNLASVISTTGFATTDYSQWGPLAEVIFFSAMMVCGCSGSTAGGPKVFRYQLLFAAIRGEVRRLHTPHAVHVPRFQGVAVADEVFDSVIAFFMMFFLTLACGAIALTLLGLDPVSAISGAAAMLSNVGPGLGPLIGPAGNYATLPEPAKWVCSFLMLAGRLELLTLYVLFTAPFWRA
ncbi:MAG: TrkH family potassium uptake protein [Amaricoccus sp.]